jgi:hypothetical protein
MSGFWFNVRVGRRFVQWHRGRWYPRVNRMDDVWMKTFKVHPYSVRVFTLFGRELGAGRHG